MFGIFSYSYVLKHRISNELKAVPAVQLDRKQFRRQYKLNKVEWDAAIDFLRDSDLDSLAIGRHDITDKTYANVQEYTTVSSKDFEAHKDYIDIQFVVKGQEIVEVAPVTCAENETAPYSKEKDVVFFSSARNVDEILISPDVFCILFPSEAHKPGISYETPSDMRKVIVKIPFVK